MNKLFDTSITKKDTCLSYAFNRTGTKTTIEFVEDLEKEFEVIPVKETKLEVGDIVAWEKKEKTILAATSITAPSNEGLSEMTFDHVNTRFHIGVVESKCLISDLTRSANPYYIPSIRKRYLSLIVDDYQKQCPVPDFVIRKRNESSRTT